MKGNMIFEKMADFILKRSKGIIVAWIIVLLVSAGVILTQHTSLKYDMTTMQMKDRPDSVIGQDIIDAEFYDSGTTSASTVVVIKYTNSADLATFSANFDALINSKYPDGSVSPAVTTAGMPSKDGTYNVAIISMVYSNGINGEDYVQPIRDIISEALSGINVTGTFETYVTGSDAITYDTQASSSKDMAMIDPFSILLILVLIGLFFRSFVAAATPPMVVGAAYGIMLCLIFFLGGVMNIFYITPILMLVSMLGAGCDYSIFMIARYREERKGGKEKQAALRESIRWAGESITTSGMSVIIGFGVLSFCSFSMISTMGVVLALGIVIALLAALTFIPSILSLTGDRIFYPSKVETYQEGSKAMNGWYGNWSRRGKRYFRSAAEHSIKYAKPIVIMAVLITVPMAYLTFTQETSYDMIGTMAPGEAKDGVNVMVDTMGGGMLMPTYIVTEFTQPLAQIIPDPSGQGGTLIWDPAYIPYVPALIGMDLMLMGIDNISSVLSLNLPNPMSPLAYAMGLPVWGYITSADTATYIVDVQAGLIALGIDASTATMIVNNIETAGNGLIANATQAGVDVRTYVSELDYAAYTQGFISVDGTYTKTTVMMTDEPMSNKSMGTIDELRGVIAGILKNDNTGLVAGAWVTGGPATTYDISNIVNNEFKWIELGVVILIFLLLFFVLRSYLTPLRAILTILMSIAWTIGLTHLLFGQVLGVPVLWMIPIILLVVCLGLGMDYDILLTTRIRENVLKGKSNDEAITNALEKSGAVITICGLIMAGTFSTLMLSSAPMLQEFGFALGVAILMDALVIRTYVVPALMHLMGDWNWKGPKWMHRVKEIPEETGEKTDAVVNDTALAEPSPVKDISNAEPQETT